MKCWQQHWPPSADEMADDRAFVDPWMILESESEDLTYTDSTNMVVGPLSLTPLDSVSVYVTPAGGPLQHTPQDYTVRECIGGSTPGWYLCIDPASSAPGGGTWDGGTNPGTGIASTLEVGDSVRVLYAL